METDHINRNKLDNQRHNLRVATRKQNLYNRAARKNISHYKGVYWDKKLEKWRSLISVNGKLKHLGFYQDKMIAALIYNIASIGYHGKFGFRNDLTSLERN